MRLLPVIACSVFLIGCNVKPEKQRIDVPKVSEAEIAISAVKAWKSEEKSLTVGEYETWMQSVNKSLGTSPKSVGWGAVPSGDNWLVTWSYFGKTGLQRTAKWSAKLTDPPTVEPMDSFAKEIGKMAVGVASRTREQSPQ